MSERRSGQRQDRSGPVSNSSLELTSRLPITEDKVRLLTYEGD